MKYINSQTGQLNDYCFNIILIPISALFSSVIVVICLSILSLILIKN